jgi:DNA-binding NarL/FixJ family response regulator
MKILVVDDHALIREAMAAVVSEAIPGCTLLIAASAKAAAVLLDQHTGIDLALLDIQLQDGDGLELLAQWRSVFPAMAVAMLSGLRDPQVVRAALDLGACGFLPKTDPRVVTLGALRLILSGGIYVPHDLVGFAPVPVFAYVSPSSRKDSEDALTPRQRDVLKLLKKGYSNKRICRALDLAEPTVKNHVSVILRVLGVSSRTEAVLRASGQR